MRRILQRSLFALGIVLLLLSAVTVAFAQWSDWQERQAQMGGPQEVLPGRLDVQLVDEAGDLSRSPLASSLTDGSEAEAPRPIEEPRAAAPAIQAASSETPTLPPERDPVTGTVAMAPTAIHSAVPDAEALWPATLAELEPVWEVDWPRAIAILEAFRERFPDHAAANEKLYAALVSEGQALIASGLVGAATERLERAQALSANPGEAVVALRQLTPTPSPTPAPEPPARGAPYGRPTWMTVPRIGVNSGVSEVGLAYGEYQVPSFNVGYHADSAAPGERGNAVFNGHLTTINAGRVFLRLQELRPGDAVYVYTPTHRLDWVVQSARTVPTSDYSFIHPAADTRITLYTCAGRYNPLTRAYTHWHAVVGSLAYVSPRS